MDIRLPEYRRLRVYAIDPSLAARHETAAINEIVLTVPWEQNPRELYGGRRMVGPVGNYLEIVDYDPASGCCYAPIDLNHIAVVARDGLSPSELNPQFHQQMVYAVAMKTIEHFERALGRPVFWSRDMRPGAPDDGYTARIRIYPHALREANAFYNPSKKAILFGYFQAPHNSRDVPPGTTVFTCLSHDVAAHEVTHALLDGLHHRFAEPTNPDILALHEAFADIVAIFQHFSNADVLKNQIGRTRGDLEQQNMLGQLAQQFGSATGRGKALRDALGVERNGVWTRYLPNPSFLAAATEPHERGAVLVAATFDAFLRMYKARVVDLLRIASNGSGILAPGELHPDLVNRLAEEAAKTATHLLQMCIRALDYCPPVDVTFGDYLRALITADRDLFPVDDHHYRTAVMQSFSLFGIRPSNVRNVSIEALLLQPRPPGETHAVPVAVRADLSDDADRRASYRQSRRYCRLVHDWLADARRSALLESIGIVTGKVVPSITNRNGIASFEVHSVRTALRRGSKTNLVPDLVIEITQRRFGYFDRTVQAEIDAGRREPPQQRDFTLRAGCTLIVDPRTRFVRWLARTPHRVDDDSALDRLRDFVLEGGAGGMNAFSPPVEPRDRGNQFAAVHRD